MRVDRLLAEVDGIRDDLAEGAGTVRGLVRIGTIQATDPYDLPAALAAFHRGHPEVQLRLGPGRRRELLDRLAAGDIDLAVALHPLSSEPLHRTLALIRSRRALPGRAVEACTAFLASGDS